MTIVSAKRATRNSGGSLRGGASNSTSSSTSTIIITVALFVSISALLILGLGFTWWKKRNDRRSQRHHHDDQMISERHYSSIEEREEKNSQQKKEEDSVCLTAAEFDRLVQKATASVAKPSPHPSASPPLYLRDKRVLHDQLYPPLNREERDLFMFAPPPAIDTTGHKEDTFRLLGYITYTDSDAHTKKDAGNNTWKCMGRMKNRHEGEFYAVPANTNDDLKIPLEPGTLASGRLHDVDTIPDELRFNSPFFNKGVYTYVALPKRELGSLYF